MLEGPCYFLLNHWIIVMVIGQLLIIKVILIVGVLAAHEESDILFGFVILTIGLLTH